MNDDTRAAGIAAFETLFGDPVDPSRSDDVMDPVRENAAVSDMQAARDALAKAEASGDPADMEMARALTLVATRTDSPIQPNPAQGSHSVPMEKRTLGDAIGDMVARAYPTGDPWF